MLKLGASREWEGDGTPMKNNRLLRHALATLAYRTNSALRGVPESFGDFDAGAGVRTPHQLVNHMTHLVGYTGREIRGERGNPIEALDDFNAEVERFRDLVDDLSALLAMAPLDRAGLDEKLLQGPISDAMTHVGQLALLRRLAGEPVAEENFFSADIGSGRGTEEES